MNPYRVVERLVAALLIFLMVILLIGMIGFAISQLICLSVPSDWASLPSYLIGYGVTIAVFCLIAFGPKIGGKWRNARQQWDANKLGSRGESENA